MTPKQYFQSWIEQNIYHRDSVPAGFVFQEKSVRDLYGRLQAQIEALEKRNAELEAEKAKLAWCYEQSEKDLRTIAAMVCGTRGNVLQDVKNLVAPSSPIEQGRKEPDSEQKCECGKWRNQHINDYCWNPPHTEKFKPIPKAKERP